MMMGRSKMEVIILRIESGLKSTMSCDIAKNKDDNKHKDVVLNG